MRREIKALLVIAIILPIIVAAISWSRESEQIPETTYPLVIRDDVGRTVKLGSEPERIVSLAPGNTEILFALGLEKRVVGVSDQCDYPAEARDKPKVGGFATISIERTVSLKPDVVLASGSIQLEIADQLSDLGIKTIVLFPRTIESILGDIELVGEVTNRNSEAKALVTRLRGRIEFIRAGTRQLMSRPRVYYEIWHSPLMSAGHGTWIDELIELSGGRNIFSDSSDPYPIISSELVIERDPEIIIINRGYMGGEARGEMLRRAGWDRISAVISGRIYEMDENLLVRPGPRIVDGLEALAKAIHPELFG